MMKNIREYLKHLSLKKQLVVLSIVCVVILLLGLILIQSMNKFNFDNRIEKMQGKPAEVLREEIQRKADESMFSARINSVIEIEDINKEVPLYIRNPEENKNNTFVEIISNESGEIIYKSPVLKPGEGIVRDKLQKLPKEKEKLYTAKFYILEGEKTISSIEYELTIEVKK